MQTFRKVILPILRVLIWAVIAFALVRLAFGTTKTDNAEQTPTFNPVDPTVPVMIGSVQNLVSLDGTISADPATDVRVTLAGNVTSVLATQGQWVDIGTPLFEITQTIEQEPIVNQTTGQVTNRPPKVTKTTISSPVAGTLTDFTILKDQIVSVGEVSAKVSPGTLSISASLTPEQQFRLITMPTTGSVNINGGPAPFECTNLRLVTDTGGGTDPNNGGGGGTPSTGNTVTCNIPPGNTVFAGLTGKLEIVSGESNDVLIVPTTAVQGRVQTGNVWKVADDGTNQMVQVGLGLTDGTNIEITSGLAEGDMILQFAPTGDQQVPTDEFGNPIMEGSSGGEVVATVSVEG